MSGVIASDDLNNFQVVAACKCRWKNRRGDGFSVVLHDDAARQELMRDQKRFNRTGHVAATDLPLAMI